MSLAPLAPFLDPFGFAQGKTFARNDKWLPLSRACASPAAVSLEARATLEPQLHPAVRGAAERGETENFRVVFVR
jgi:hypothetical protein